MQTLIQLLSFFLLSQLEFAAAFPGRGHRHVHSSPSSSFKDSLVKKELLLGTVTALEVNGEHAFVAPDFEAGDQRGPCPILNALANHNYIPHNGVTSLLETYQAISKVMGMGVDLATLLAVLATVFVGNPLSLNPGFSIGGSTPGATNLLGNLLGLVGNPTGLNGSHNLIEADSSLTRADLYDTGDCSTMKLDLFESWFGMSNDEYDFDLMALRAHTRLQESKAENPNFYYGPLSGLVIRNAGYIFGSRLIANHSGSTASLTGDMIKSFFAVSGEPGKFTYTRGHERFPENWYRRPGSYGMVDLNIDILAMGLQYPDIFSVGGNMGAVNTFAGLDFANITGGVYNSASLLEGNNLLCFSMQIVKFMAPSFLAAIFSVIGGVLGTVLNALPLLSLNCPAWDDMTSGGGDLKDIIMGQYPGAVLSGRAW